MVGVLSRISLVALGLAGLTGVALARDAAIPKAGGHLRSAQVFKPAYRADTRVTGPAQPYTWPVADRYRPVSQPYFGKAY